MQNTFFIILLTFFFQQALVCKGKIKVFTVHGTFAKSSTWYRQGGDFFKELERWAKDSGCQLDIVPCSWSGGLAPGKRLEGAAELAKLIAAHSCGLDPDTKKIVVGHSHGANVAFLATQLISMTSSGRDLEGDVTGLVNRCFDSEKDLLSVERGHMPFRSICDDKDFAKSDLKSDLIHSPDRKELSDKIIKDLEGLTATRGPSSGQPLKIDEIYALGTPIDATIYLPDKNAVDRVFSIYSEKDQIQIYTSQFKRRFAEFGVIGVDRGFITEIKATFTKSPEVKKLDHPKHLQLNTSCFGRWVLEIPKIVGPSETGRRHLNNCRQTWLNFFKDLSKPELRQI